MEIRGFSLRDALLQIDSSEGEEYPSLTKRIDKVFLNIQETIQALDYRIIKNRGKIASLENNIKEKQCLPPLIEAKKALCCEENEFDNESDLCCIVYDSIIYWCCFPICFSIYGPGLLFDYIYFRKETKTIKEKTNENEQIKTLKKQIEVLDTECTIALSKDLLEIVFPYLHKFAKKELSFSQSTSLTEDTIIDAFHKKAFSPTVEICWSKLFALSKASLDQVIATFEEEEFIHLFCSVDRFLETYIARIPEKYVENLKVREGVASVIHELLGEKVHLDERNWNQMLQKLQLGFTLEEFFHHRSITLLVKGEEIVESRSIIQSISNSLRALMTEDTCRIDKEFIEISSISPETMRTILHFTKTGSITLTLENLPELFLAADQYEMKTLLKRIEKYLFTFKTPPPKLMKVLEQFSHITFCKMYLASHFLEKLEKLNPLKDKECFLSLYFSIKRVDEEEEKKEAINLLIKKHYDDWTESTVKVRKPLMKKLIEGFDFFLNFPDMKKSINSSLDDLCAQDLHFIKNIWESVEKSGNTQLKELLIDFCKQNIDITQIAWYITPKELKPGLKPIS